MDDTSLPKQQQGQAANPPQPPTVSPVAQPVSSMPAGEQSQVTPSQPVQPVVTPPIAQDVGPLPTINPTVYQTNPVQSPAPQPKVPPEEVTKRVASWYEPSEGSLPEQPQQQPVPAPHEQVVSADIPQQSQEAPVNIQPEPEVVPIAPPELNKIQETTVSPAGSVPPLPPQLFPEDEHHGFIPKPLRLILGVLAVLLIAFVGFKLISGLLQGGSKQKVTLTYWGLWEDATVMQPVIADFEKENPNIKVTYEKEDPKEYNQRVLTRIQDGNGPDIFRYHTSWLPEFLPALLPLSKDVISSDDLTQNYFPVVKNDVVKNGAIYGVPLGIDTLALFVNNSLLQKAKASVPSTWDTFITVARGLTEKDATGKIKVAGASIGTFDNITHAPDLVSLLLVQNGVDLATMTPAQNASDALTFYTSFAKDQTSVWDDTLDPSQLGFSRGNVAMYFGYSWDIFAIKAANPSLDFSVYPVPHLPGRETTIASYWVEGVSSKSKHPKEALLFMKYLARKDTLTKLYTEEAKTRLFGELYPRKDLSASLTDNKLIAPFVQQSGNAVSSFFAGDTKDTGINAQMNGYLKNAVQSVLKDTSPQSALETLTKGVAQVLQQYGQTQQQ